MKVKIITTLILLIPILGFSQINQSIDFIGGTEYSYRNLTTSTENGFLESRDNRESGKINSRIGFNYNRRLTNKIFLKTGLRLVNSGYKDELSLTWSVLNPTPAHTTEYQLAHNYSFIEIPIAGRFEINQKKLSPFFELGISPSIYIKTRTKLISTNEQSSQSEPAPGAPSFEPYELDTEFLKRDDSNFNKLHFVGFISFGMNYSLTDKFQFFGQPTFRYHLTKLEDAPINEYLFNCGIEIGVRRKIN